MSDVCRVWVLEPCGYDEYGIVGVFATVEVAKAYLPQGKWREEAEENGDWYTEGRDLAMRGGYHVYAEEVRT